MKGTIFGNVFNFNKNPLSKFVGFIKNKIQKSKDDFVIPYNLNKQVFGDNKFKAGYKASLEWAKEHPLGTASIAGAGLISSKTLSDKKNKK